jgi:hypothetical protein
MEKLILAIYVHVGNMSPADIAEHMDRMMGSLNNKDENILHYVIPIQEGNSRIECLNPKLVLEKDYDKIQEIIENNQKIVDEFLNKYKLL